MSQEGVSQGDKCPQRHRGKATCFRGDKQVAAPRALSTGEDNTGCGSSGLQVQVQVQLPLVSDSVTAAWEGEVIFSESPCKWQRLDVPSVHAPFVLCDVTPCTHRRLGHLRPHVRLTWQTSPTKPCTVSPRCLNPALPAAYRRGVVGW